MLGQVANRRAIPALLILAQTLMNMPLGTKRGDFVPSKCCPIQDLHRGGHINSLNL